MLLVLMANRNRATENPNNDYQQVIDTYRSCFLTTDYKKFKKILSPNAILAYSVGERVMKYDASAVLDNMFKNQGMAQQECEAKTMIIVASSSLVMAQIDVNYLQFNNRQKHILTLEKDQEGKWKIANIYKYFFNQ